MNIDLKLLDKQIQELALFTSNFQGEYRKTHPIIHNTLNFLISVRNNNEKEFPNGISDYLETHHEIVHEIALINNMEKFRSSEIVDKAQEKQGHGGLYDLAIDLTTKFEQENKGVNWGEEKEYFDTINAFIERELYGNK